MGGHTHDNPKSPQLKRSSNFVWWDTKRPSRAGNLSLEDIGSFNARGMRRIFGRGDMFPGLPGYNMDIWVARNGRVLIRFWSRGSYVDPCSFELHGLVVPAATLSGEKQLDEGVVPAIVRDRYDEWVIDRIEFPYE